MKKVNNSKNSPAKKTTANVKETGEFKKVSKLKPLKEKEKKGWITTKLVLTSSKIHIHPVKQAKHSFHHNYSYQGQ